MQWSPGKCYNCKLDINNHVYKAYDRNFCSNYCRRNIIMNYKFNNAYQLELRDNSNYPNSKSKKNPYVINDYKPNDNDIKTDLEIDKLFRIRDYYSLNINSNLNKTICLNKNFIKDISYNHIYNYIPSYNTIAKNLNSIYRKLNELGYILSDYHYC